MKFAPLYRILPISLLFTFVLSVPAQKAKWGKVSEKEMKYSSCMFDTTASAVVLSDVGLISIQYSSIPITVERHIRIKILNERGLDQASRELFYYAKDGMEKIISVKAQTLKLVKGNVVKIPVPKEEFYDTEYNQYYNVLRFAFPSVEPGDIIEFKYTLLDKNVVIPEGWDFQCEIPTLYSEYSAIVQDGWDVRVIYTSDLLARKYGNVQAKEWVLENLPAIKDEPLCPNPHDYANSLTFQLAGYISSGFRGGTGYTTISLDWEALANEFLNSNEYVEFLAQYREIKSLGEIFSLVPEEERIRTVYDHVVTHYKWNGNYRSFPEKRFGKLLETTGGSSAELNLLLINLLRASGLKADPVLVSTRSHGKIRKEYPILRQFNQVIACVQAGDELVFLDATDPLKPMGVLDPEDYNEEGFRLIRGASSWVPLPEAPLTKYQCLCDIDLRDTENPSVHVQLRISGLDAYELRSKMGKDVQLGEYLRKQVLNTELGLDILGEVTAENLYDPYGDLSFSFDLVPSSLITDMNHLITAVPFVLGVYNEAPLNPGYRVLPIDFGNKERIQQISNIYLPDELTISSMPKTDKMKLENERMKFSYLILKLDGKLQLVHDLYLNETFFSPRELNAILEIFNCSINRLTEPVVIEERQ